MKILVTGGPVHGYLDPVKIVTNRFRGGLMLALAEQLSEHHEVVYLCSALVPQKSDKCRVIHHDGIDEYREHVLSMAPDMNGVVLGAAVANLLPLNPLTHKFPSHHYKPGAVIPISFTIAPRIIDAVHVFAPKTHLFGFKLLKDVPFDELISAAYGVLLESKATAIFANDATDLQRVFMVTKERGVHAISRVGIAHLITQFLSDQYYRTDISVGDWPNPQSKVEHQRRFRASDLVRQFRHRLTSVEHDYIFGTVAVRLEHGFVTTSRGKTTKDDLYNFVRVFSVDHENRVVTASGKATLNAPLLDDIFAANPEVDEIVHLHEQRPDFPQLEYAPPGTVRDSRRSMRTSFNIEAHGCFLLIKENQVITPSGLVVLRNFE